MTGLTSLLRASTIAWISEGFVFIRQPRAFYIRKKLLNLHAGVWGQCNLQIVQS
ncbi:hypothetical protein MESS2_1020006 [Mesorhizobium metallidurans STM 2683]|uniref:Uncharacterized protein n=1 Tax=Mesorhizobium metallidurans STM 2683 TaxID=1297569 RepID=M5EFN3_9HYPH|nr:hypothetical protein MESS2_1020006 [Mesorhizobium metallidurans STM 2683]